MSLEKNAEELIVLESDLQNNDDLNYSHDKNDEGHKHEDHEHEEHEHEEHEEHEQHEEEHDGAIVSVEDTGDELVAVPLEVIEQSSDPIDNGFEITISVLPGAPDGTPDPEPEIVVVDDKKDDNDLKEKNKKKEKWDWSARGATGFIDWVKERLSHVPKHSGYDSAGLERAISFFERLDDEISKAMRLDIDGELDANKIEKIRSEIENGVERLEDRLEKVKDSKKGKKKKASDEVDSGLIKEAQKITGVKGIIITVDLLTSRIARVCINSKISAGHDISRTFAEQVKKYSLNNRERAQVIQLMEDMGYPIKEDRAYFPEEESTGNGDWATNYPGV